MSDTEKTLQIFDAENAEWLRQTKKTASRTASIVKMLQKHVQNMHYSSRDAENAEYKTVCDLLQILLNFAEDEVASCESQLNQKGE